MKLRNVCPLGVSLDVPLLRRAVDFGEDIDVTVDQARRLLPSVNFDPADDEAAAVEAELADDEPEYDTRDADQEDDQ